MKIAKKISKNQSLDSELKKQFISLLIKINEDNDLDDSKETWIKLYGLNKIFFNDLDEVIQQRQINSIDSRIISMEKELYYIGYLFMIPMSIVIGREMDHRFILECLELIITILKHKK